MKIGIEDRILLYGLFPQKGEYELLVAFRELDKLVKFSEEETRTYDINQNVDTKTGLSQITYNKEVSDEAGDTKDVNIPHRALSYVVEKLEEMSADGELTYQFIPLYEKIVLGKKKNVRDINKSSKGNNR